MPKLRVEEVWIGAYLAAEQQGTGAIKSEEDGRMFDGKRIGVKETTGWVDVRASKRDRDDEDNNCGPDLCFSGPGELWVNMLLRMENYWVGLALRCPLPAGGRANVGGAGVGAATNLVE